MGLLKHDAADVDGSSKKPVKLTTICPPGFVIASPRGVQYKSSHVNFESNCVTL